MSGCERREQVSLWYAILWGFGRIVKWYRLLSYRGQKPVWEAQTKVASGIAPERALRTPLSNRCRRSIACTPQLLSKSHLQLRRDGRVSPLRAIVSSCVLACRPAASYPPKLVRPPPAHPVPAELPSAGSVLVRHDQGRASDRDCRE